MMRSFNRLKEKALTRMKICQKRIFTISHRITNRCTISKKQDIGPVCIVETPMPGLHEV